VKGTFFMVPTFLLFILLMEQYHPNGSHFSAAPLLKGMIELIKFPLYRCSPFFGNESKLSPDKNTRFPTINV
jgi:hypothetical protein